MSCVVTLEKLSPIKQRPSRSLQITKAAKSISKQNDIEKAIIKYQNSLNTGSKLDINRSYDEICTLYPPLGYVHVWFSKYRHLYDTREDFVQDYLRIFCTCLAKWKPRDTRKESKWGGNGKFENFFWSALNNSYINMVKQESSGKRNLSSKCPICNDWTNPLSTHLLDKHEHLLWENIENFGMYIDDMTNCPFCKSHRVKHVTTCQHSIKACETCKFQSANKSLRKHLLSMHSGYLFEQFRIDFPNHTTISSKPISVMVESNDESADQSIYDLTPSNTTVETVLSYDLSPIQRKIIEKVFNGTLKLKYDGKLYNCSQEEYQKELESLQQLLIISGISEKFGE